MPQEPLKSMKKNTNITNDLPTVTVTSKLDPRLKAYQDSLNLYNASKAAKDAHDKNVTETLKFHNIKSNLNEKQTNDYYNKNINPIIEDEILKWDKLSKLENASKIKASEKSSISNLNLNDEIVNIPYKTFKKPTQPVKYQKPQDIPIENVKKDIPSTSLSIMKKPEVVVQKQNNYDEGESIMLPIPAKLGGGGGAFIGTKKKDGTIEYVKPEDFKRMGVPPYGQEFILNQLAQEKK